MQRCTGNCGRDWLQQMASRLVAIDEVLQRVRNPSRTWSPHRMTNGFPVTAPELIQTLLVVRYSSIAAAPFSRPIPESL